MEWTVTAPTWQPAQGYNPDGTPKLTLMQQVCALGACITGGHLEDAANHCRHLLSDLQVQEYPEILRSKA